MKTAKLTVAQAAARLGVAPRTVRGWIARDVIRAQAVTDRLYLIDSREVARIAKDLPTAGRPRRTP